jgi:hypothetical protein
LKNTTEYTLDELAKMVIASNQKLLEFSVKNHEWEFELTTDGARVTVKRKTNYKKEGLWTRLLGTLGYGS